MVALVNDPVSVLLRQHDELLARLAGAEDGLAAATAPLAAYLEAELGPHFALEETELFPRLVGCSEIAPETIPLLLAEHRRARVLVGELARAIGEDAIAERVRVAREVIDLLRAHVAKEDAMLLAVAVVLRP